MKDFPVFTTEYGVAGLVLKEIPYRQEAYITIRSSQEPEKLLEECVSFCRMCGAEKIYAAGWEGLTCFPLFTTILEMRGTAWVAPEQLRSLFPVTEQTVARWREVYNERMKDVPCAATMTSRDEKEILESGGAYFVHEDGQLLGIFWVKETKLLAITSIKPGAGQYVMHTMMSVAEGSQMQLQVASTNDRAIRFYQKMGFLAVNEVVRWYQVQ